MKKEPQKNESVVQLYSKCPICGKPSTFNYRPFCSKRCADVDLNRWLGGVYCIETEETASDSFIETDES